MGRTPAQFISGSGRRSGTGPNIDKMGGYAYAMPRTGRIDGELAAFMQRLTITHVRRWLEHRDHAGLGRVYQGRYKSVPVDTEEHF